MTETSPLAEVLFRSILEPANRSAQRQMAAIDRQEVHIASGDPGFDFAYGLSMQIEVAERTVVRTRDRRRNSPSPRLADRRRV
jgi:hypothetical protein